IPCRGPSGPMGQKLTGVGSDPVPVVCSPLLDLTADVVDERVLLPPLSCDVEVEGLLGGVPNLPISRYRDVGLARPSPGEECAGGSAWSNLEMGLGRAVRRVDNWITDVPSGHVPSPLRLAASA